MPTADVWEFNTQSFLIRLWIEEPATETQKATWRGHVTHIATVGDLPDERAADPALADPAVTGPGIAGLWALAPGERRYVQDLADITQFLAAFLRQMGAEI